MKKVTKTSSKKSTKPPARKAAKGSTTPKPKRDPKRKMNPELEKKCVVIKGLLLTSDIASLQARRDIGKQVAEVEQDAARYGDGAVANLAKALGRDADTLYDCAHVFALLENRKLDAIAKARSVHELPLSFSHWVVIANVCENALRDGDEQHDKKAHDGDVKRAEGLALNALEKGWSVRKLKDEANPEKKDVGQDAAARVSDALVASKKRLDRDLSVVVSELKAGNVSEERRTVARQLIERLGEVRDAANRGIADLQGALDPASSDVEEKAPLSADAPDGVPQSPTSTSMPALEAMHRMVAR